jgi:hypothetical protein
MSSLRSLSESNLGGESSSRKNDFHGRVARQQSKKEVKEKSFSVTRTTNFICFAFLVKKFTIGWNRNRNFYLSL